MTKLYTLIFFLIFNISSAQDYINIVRYGASTSLADNSAQIQKAIDDNPYRTIFFPSSKGGFFRVSKPIIINHPIVIKGEGKQNTIFQPVNCIGFVIQSSNVSIEDMFIYGYSSDGGNYTGIYCELNTKSAGEDRLSNLNFESLKLQNLHIGIELKNAWSCTLNKIHTVVHATQTPKMNQGIRFFGQCVNNQISDCNIIAEGAAIAIIRENPNNLDPLKNNKTKRAEGLMITNSFISGNTAIYSEGILSLNVSNCVIDLNKEIAIQCYHTDHFKLSNNWIAVYIAPQPNQPAIELMSSIYANISNNTIVYTNNLGLTAQELSSIKDKVGISFENGSNNNIVIGNTFLNTDYIVLNKTGAQENIIKDNTPTQ